MRLQSDVVLAILLGIWWTEGRFFNINGHMGEDGGVFEDEFGWWCVRCEVG